MKIRILTGSIPRGRNRSGTFVAATLRCAAAVSALIFAACGHKPEHSAVTSPDLPPVTVKVQMVNTNSQVMTEEVVGTVRARLRATLEAKVSGRIDAMPVVLGQKVKAGELLARLDAGEIKARVEQVEASVDQAEREWKRVSALFKEQATTRAEYDAAESRLRVARGALSEARAMQAYVEVVAPFAGVITKKWADVGDLATPGKPLIGLEDTTVMQLAADVPEAIANRVQPNAKMVVRVDAISSELTGAVSEIAPVADPDSRTFQVKLDLSSVPGLMPGQFARLVVPIGECLSLRVPPSAVVRRGQLEIVFVVDEQKRARLHLVKTGKSAGDQVEILSGLDPGDAVVVENAHLLADSQPVTL